MNSSKIKYLFALLLVIFLAYCSSSVQQPSISQKPFGTVNDQPVELYTLSNEKGMTVQITNYGGIITHWFAPDRNGKLADVVLGYDDLAGYRKISPYFGAIIGRYGNRIAKGMFSLNGQSYTLATNNGPNHLHGGVIGFDKVVWQAEARMNEKIPTLILRYLSPDGEEGYPGNLNVQVIYSLTPANELKIEYHAVTDKPTICNLTNHTYFNFKDGGASPITDHLLQIDADSITPVDDTLIPTGELAAVDNTPFDFRRPTPIGARIDQEDDQLRKGGGYDHNFVINGPARTLRRAATLSETTSGRVMDVFTTEPGMQFYSGNFLDGSIIGKNNITYAFRHGVCLETHHFPDSPNHPNFPTVILNPGEEYSSTTIYAFRTFEQ